ncbi:TSUP family transporter [Rhizobium brockwellii]|uniref:TSUP family transporter n=1 Tax=Rhizobium brockwellii TaxID=3019932 RepID=UPI003F947163
MILSALQMARTAFRGRSSAPDAIYTPPFGAAQATGAVIGFVSGTTGTGGGVFLSPIIISMKWGAVRQSAATTAVYNLMNSGAALLGAYAAWDQIPANLPIWLMAVAVGGIVGAYVGSRYLPERWLRAILALSLLASGMKLVL